MRGREIGLVSRMAGMGPTLLLTLAKEHRLKTGEGPVKTPDADELARLLLPVKEWENLLPQTMRPIRVNKASG